MYLIFYNLFDYNQYYYPKFIIIEMYFWNNYHDSLQQQYLMADITDNGYKTVNIKRSASMVHSEQIS